MTSHVPFGNMMEVSRATTLIMSWPRDTSMSLRRNGCVALFEDHDVGVFAYQVQVVRKRLAHRNARIFVGGEIDRDGHNVAGPGSVEAIVRRAAVRAAYQ